MSGLVTLGEAMLTITADQIGSLRHVRSFSASMAGSEATVAIAVRRLGHPAAWISRVGDDEPGELILDRMRAEDITLHVERGHGPTGLMLKEIPRAGSRRVGYYRAGSAAAELDPTDLPTGVIEAAAIVHVTGITMALGARPRAAVVDAVSRAHRAGVTITLDVNHRERLWTLDDARQAIGPLLPDIDILFASVPEAAGLLDSASTDLAELARGLHAQGAGAVIITDGPNGALTCDEDGTARIPASPATEIDPFGAGDAFVGGTLASILDGTSMPIAAAQGARVAALAVAAPGDWEGLPRRRDLPAGVGGDIDR